MKKGERELKEKEVNIVVPEPAWKLIYVPIKAQENSTYIPHKKSELAMGKIKARQKGEVVKKTFKDEEAQKKEYESCFHKTTTGKVGHIAIAFKKAMLGVITGFTELKLNHCKIAFHIMADVIPFTSHAEPRIRNDYLPVGRGGGTDWRIRPEIDWWKAVLPIKYNADLLTREAVLNLVKLSGMGGIGEGRPSAPKCGDSHGMFELDRAIQVREIEIR